MGYSVYVEESNFFISKDNFIDITILLDNNPRIVSEFNIEDIENIEDIFYNVGFDIEFDEDGNVNNIYSEENFRLYNQEEFLKLIQNYIRDGSYIECLGEDGNKWRWTKYNGKIVYHKPKLVWDIDL